MCLQKTVVAILDCMISPNWPQLPERKENYTSHQEEEDIEHTWTSVPDDPMDYNFYFQVLDGDDRGRMPKGVDSVRKEVQFNPHFNWSAKSCLYSIAHSQNKVCIPWAPEIMNFLCHSPCTFPALNHNLPFPKPHPSPSPNHTLSLPQTMSFPCNWILFLNFAGGYTTSSCTPFSEEKMGWVWSLLVLVRNLSDKDGY